MLALFAVVFCSQSVLAQQRTEIAKGVFIVSYGNVTVIENDNTQQTVRIKVQKKDDSLYDIICGDTIVKTVAKAGLRKGIAYAIQSYTTIPKWITEPVVGVVVETVYEGACNYFRD